jgi:hypothetical protein
MARESAADRIELRSFKVALREKLISAASVRLCPLDDRAFCG